MALDRSLHNLKPESVREFFGLATVEIRRSLIDLIRHHFGPEGAAAKHHSDVLGELSGDGGVLQNQPADNLKPETIDAWTRFHQSVEELPVDQSEVFHLVWYGGMEQKEIADLLGISVSTVKRRFRSARFQMFSAMDGESPLSEEQV